MQEGALSSHLFHFRHARLRAASLAKEKSNEGVALRPANLVLFSKSPFRNVSTPPSLSRRYGDLLLRGQNIYDGSREKRFPGLLNSEGIQERERERERDYTCPHISSPRWPKPLSPLEVSPFPSTATSSDSPPSACPSAASALTCWLFVGNGQSHG